MSFEHQDEMTTAAPLKPIIVADRHRSQPWRCPVCGGKGLVPLGFYTQVTGYWGSTGTSPEEKCRSCDGKGYVVV